MMTAAAEKFREGAPTIGTTGPRVRQVDLASFEGVVPRTTDWRTLGMREDAAMMAK
jgi:phthalate 4,5-dioxygenase